MSIVGKSGELINVLRTRVTSAEFVSGFNKQIRQRKITKPLVTLWSDTYLQERGNTQIKILMSMYLGDAEYSQGIEIYDEIFAVLREEFPHLISIKRNSPEAEGANVIINCSAQVKAATSFILDSEEIEAEHISFAQEEVQTLYTEVFEDQPIKVCGGRVVYKIFLSYPACAAEKLRSCQKLSAGGNDYYGCVLARLEIEDGLVTMAELNALTKEEG